MPRSGRLVLFEPADRFCVVAGVLEHATPDSVLIPVSLVEDEKSVRACGLDEIPDLRADEELPPGRGAATRGVEAADSKFVDVHGCLLWTRGDVVRHRVTSSSRAHGLSSVDARTALWRRSEAAVASCDVDMNVAIAR
jgi:hypothetical protein